MRRAIVTGGTRGIGFAIARAIAHDGGAVMVAGTHPERVTSAVERLGADAGRAAQVAGTVCDVRDRASVERLVASTVERFGGVNTLVNNAGVGAFAEVASMTDEDWHRVIDTNLTGVFLCTRAALPELRRARGAWIINIASLSARNPFSGGAAYCASKAGLVAFTEALMAEVRFDDIRVSVVLPGSVATEFSAPHQGTDDSWKLTAEDVALAVMDLLRHESRSLPSRVEIRPSRPKKA